MKKLLVAGLVTAVAALPAADALAQRDRAQGEPQRQVWQNREGLMESKRLIGTAVHNDRGDRVGEIDQLLIDPKDGKVAHAVIGMGGFAGIGERKVVVGWNEVKMSAGAPARGETAGRGEEAVPRGQMMVRVDQSVLDRAPRYQGTARERQAPAASPKTTPERGPGTKSGDQPKPQQQQEQQKY